METIDKTVESVTLPSDLSLRNESPSNESTINAEPLTYPGIEKVDDKIYFGGTSIMYWM